MCNYVFGYTTKNDKFYFAIILWRNVIIASFYNNI